MILSISQLIGQLHPAIVHLPIGILLFALLMVYLSGREKYRSLQPAIAVCLLAGAITAFLAAITGYMLSESGVNYDKILVTRHMWIGIATAGIAFLLYAKTVNPDFAFSRKLLAILLLILVIAAGYSGSLINPHFK